MNECERGSNVKVHEGPASVWQGTGQLMRAYEPMLEH